VKGRAQHDCDLVEAHPPRGLRQNPARNFDRFT